MQINLFTNKIKWSKIIRNYLLNYLKIYNYIYNFMDIVEISTNKSYKMLQNNKNAILIDVRTSEEFSAYGVADLNSIGKEPLLLPWRTLPDMSIDGSFFTKLTNNLQNKNLDLELGKIELIFICAGGVRSREAATLLSEQENYKCYNVTEGFEGNQNKSWKAENLPWRKL